MACCDLIFLVVFDSYEFYRIAQKGKRGKLMKKLFRHTGSLLAISTAVLCYIYHMYVVHTSIAQCAVFFGPP